MILGLSVSVFFLFFLMVVPVSAAEPRTSTVWSVTGEDGVDVIPYVRADKKALFVDFEGFTNEMGYVYYNLNYNQKASNVKGGVEGSFVPSGVPYTGHYNNVPYIRREILFGSCSKNVCIYHNPKNVTLTVNTQILEGKVAQYTKVLGIADDQF